MLATGVEGVRVLRVVLVLSYVFQYTLGWAKTPADHPDVYRGPVARKPS